MKSWTNKAFALLDHTLGNVPIEMNEIDWKEELSANNQKLAQHLSAFGNQPGGGFLVFGVGDAGTLKGVNQAKAAEIVEKLSSIGRDMLEPMISIDHSIEIYKDVALLIIHIKESSIKPVHFKSKTIEDAFIRSGGTTRRASRQEIGALMLNSKTPNFEELHATKLLSALEVLTSLDYRELFFR